VRNIIIVVVALVGALVACGGDDTDANKNTISADICDWETELYDGEQCLLRTDHEGHMGHH